MNNRRIAAIDIGTESIRIFIGNIQPDGSLCVKNSAFVPSQGYARGEIIDAGALAAAVKQALDCALAPGENHGDILIYAGLGSIFMLGQNSLGSIARTYADKITAQDVERACRAAVFAAEADDFEAVHVLPLNDILAEKGVLLENLGEPKDKQGLKVIVHIASLPKAVIAQLTEALRGEGVELAGIVANNIVVVRNALLNLEKEAANAIFFDIGAGTTDVAVLAAGRINHSASLSLGGNYITNDIVQGIGVNFPHAEAIKRYYAKLDRELYGRRVTLDCNDFGTTDKSVSYDFLHDIVESRVDEIVQLLYEYLKPKLDEFLYNSGKTPDKLILAGGCAALPSFAEKLFLKFGAVVETVNFPCLAPEYNSPANAACYGVFCYAGQEAAKKKSAAPEQQPATGREQTDNGGSWGFFKKNIGKLFKI